ncbi:ATP-dependent RNA helicase DOB1 [Nematocida sp. LUAm3]|nr:ATP-dependent RNA helicase DOB1 [Nematocida sp. LUAm3]KAI5175658.1 ATP-dependent RNA helicase DOB1 [Nematocida sp. LUAm2]KAI5178564.1 ATP-dependent RNA helicase DOB1 [Nematocida sp. LUAm1]
MKTSELLHAHVLPDTLNEQETFLDTAEEIDTFVETTEGNNSVRHFCIAPKDYPYASIAQANAQIRCSYPFKLDRFQELALQCLERDESVLVSAHTSAGKTLIAEYAIHLSILRKQRVIYTSPIKALSNQKYRELNEKFGDVGLMTGDVTLNPDSTCLVMTTEILRNMIYRGTEVLRETHFIVFDEVHYMRDRERGVVWEETIILLPSTTRFIFLSATIPNSDEFARWIVSIHKQPCHVIYTEKRPTPLEHYLYANQPYGTSRVKGNSLSLSNISSRLSLIVDQNGTFQSKNFLNLPKAPQSASRGKRRENINVVDILNILKETGNLPTIIFSFRRKDCEQYSIIAQKEFDFNTEEEREMIDTIFNNALNSLREEDRKLQQIVGLKSMLYRGVGVHHSGLLPIVKEIIEILFQENLLKVLFATETFSIGLNMPAKSVVFTSIKKFDGVEMRFVTSGEYIQMSGRAGRRGRDKIGNVILALESSTSLSEKQIKEVLHGPSNRLDSAFRLSYNTILNLLRLDGMDEEYIIKHSFLQFGKELLGKDIYLRKILLEELQKKLVKEYSEKLDNFSNGYFLKRYLLLKKELFQEPKRLFPFGYKTQLILPGRIVELISNTKKQEPVTHTEYNDLTKEVKKKHAIILTRTNNTIKVMAEEEKIEEIEISQIVRISKNSVPLEKGGLITVKAKQYFGDKKRRKLSEHHVEWLPYDSEVSKEAKRNLTAIEKEVSELKNQYIKELPEEDKKLFKEISKSFSIAEELKEKIEEKVREMKKTKLIMINEYKSKKKILQALSYITENEVLIKGKVASEISSGDELLLTEMLFNNEFSKLSPERICSLLSCVVFDEKADGFVLSKESEETYGILKTTMDRLISEFKRVEKEFNEKEYIDRFCSRLMDVVYKWAEGYSFADICSTTDVFEGSVIRCFRRLEEVLKEMCRASRLIGNVEMENKFSAAIGLVKRDIVFANSLYL